MAEHKASIRWQSANIIGINEDLPVRAHHNVYPFIDPSKAFEGLTHAGQVVLIVGASSGIGREVARFYARAGAAIAIVARTQVNLDETKSIILAESHNAQVLVLSADVKDHVAAARAVETTAARFGRIDILIANAGTSSPHTTLLCDKDPDLWWNTFEVNVRGVFNFVRAAIPHIRNASGRIITTTSNGAQMRLPMGSDHCTSKHALGRLVEFIAVEYPDVKIFNVHPGAVQTPLSPMAGVDKKDWDVAFPDSPELAAATMLHLTAGKADWLSGRYVSANWDLGEVERDWKDKIIATNGLVSKLFVP